MTKNVYSQGFLSSNLPVLRVPVTAEHRAGVCSEHPLITVRSADVPQLHIPILK